MKESLKWIVLYNAYFPLNHPELFRTCKEFEQQGILEIMRYKDFIKDTETMKAITDNLDDFFDIVALGKREEIGDMPYSHALLRMTKSPRKYLTSVTSFWYYPPWKKITRIDVGEPELKYLVNDELKYHKFGGKNDK